MKKAIIGKKVGMTQIFDEAGHAIPVTVIEAGPCVVTQKKTLENDGYAAIQLGFEEVAEKKLSKPEQGHLKKAGTAPMKVLKEFKLDSGAEMNVGDVIKADVFAKGEKVDITGISRGKGYAGVIKRWNAHRLKESHGTGPVHRHAGAMSANSSPSKIFPGKIGAGQMGVARPQPGHRGAEEHLEEEQDQARRFLPCEHQPAEAVRQKRIRKERVKCLLRKSITWPASVSARLNSPKPFSAPSPTAVCSMSP